MVAQIEGSGKVDGLAEKVYVLFGGGAGLVASDSVTSPGWSTLWITPRLSKIETTTSERRRTPEYASDLLFIKNSPRNSRLPTPHAHHLRSSW